MKIKLTVAKRPVKIHTPFIKLDEFLKFSGGVMTGGEAKMVIQEGLVLVNGEICLMRGKKLVPGDTVSFENTLYEVVAE